MRRSRLDHSCVAAPGLVLNYFGQGALLIAQPSAIENPFYLAYPEWALYPMVALATAATIIASQATISGAYSMTQQAIQLGYLPRMPILHTSARTIGQIYVPAVNWTLLVVVAAAVVGFGSSTRLAAVPSNNTCQSTRSPSAPRWCTTRWRLGRRSPEPSWWACCRRRYCTSCRATVGPSST